MAEIGRGAAPPPPPPLPEKTDSVLGGKFGEEVTKDRAADVDTAEGSGSKVPGEDLEDRFEGLDLCGEEETDLDFSDEIDALIGEIKWLVIFRVHTSKPFSHAALFKQICSAWTTA
jgi:hypothetical protein